MNLLCLVTALAAESRPLLDHYRLSRLPTNGLRVYRRDNIMLLETGIGKLAAASSLAALLQQQDNISGILNVGVAGGEDSIGAWFLASSFHDAGSDKRWYPHLPPARASSQLGTREVRTLDEPSSDYPPGCLFDMELAGLAAAAYRWRDTSALQAIKVVSDNPSSHWHEMTRDKVQSLVESGLTHVDEFAQWHLNDRSSSWRSTATDIAECHLALTQRHRGSQTEQNMLRRRLEQHMALYRSLPDTRALPENERLATLLTHLDEALEQRRMHLVVTESAVDRKTRNTSVADTAEDHSSRLQDGADAERQ